MKKLKSKSGFSLTEVLVSIIVLGILFGCIIGLIVTSNRLQNSMSQKYNGLVQIQEVLNQFSSGSLAETVDEKIYFDKYFDTKKTEETNFYISYTISTTDNISKIDITLNVDGSVKESFTRRVKVR